jgi:Gram-negative bacterial TonB protein C-terminal
MSKNSGLIICIVVLILQALALAKNPQETFESARRRATEATDIFSSGPVEIRIKFRLHTVAGQVEGSYRYSQLSNEQVREEIDSPNFSETILEEDGERYVARTRDIEPWAIWSMRHLVRLAHSISPDPFMSHINQSPQNGRELDCFAIERRPSSPSEYSGSKVCFDVANSAVASAEWTLNSDEDKREYTDFQETNGKYYPRTMRRIRNGKLLVEVNVESISYTTVDKALFAPPPNTSQQPVCKKFQAADAEYYENYYSIRSSHNSGSVVIGGLVDDRGKVLKAEIQESAGDELDKAALTALKQVHLSSAKCDGKHIPSFFVFQIWFGPSPHPDSFFSFQ